MLNRVLKLQSRALEELALRSDALLRELLLLLLKAPASLIKSFLLVFNDPPRPQPARRKEEI